MISRQRVKFSHAAAGLEVELEAEALSLQFYRAVWPHSLLLCFLLFPFPTSLQLHFHFSRISACVWNWLIMALTLVRLQNLSVRYIHCLTDSVFQYHNPKFLIEKICLKFFEFGHRSTPFSCSQFTWGHLIPRLFVRTLLSDKLSGMRNELEG